jgi:predicted regulator of Ras-like GTPase activity (Roadblock/LC7/MglB family)
LVSAGDFVAAVLWLIAGCWPVTNLGDIKIAMKTAVAMLDEIQ